MTFQLVRWLRGRQVEGAARGIASEQCALRATQHFGAGHVEKTEIADHRTPDIDAVNVDADGCIGEGVRAVLRLAANGKVDERGGAGAASADREGRSAARKEVGRAACGERGGQ